MIVMNKRQLRAELRALHEGQEIRDAQSAVLCRYILSSNEYQRACVIGGYMPMSHEANVLPVLKAALLNGKSLVLPLCEQAPHMTLRRVASLDDLVPGAYGILEPRQDAPVVPVEEIDLLLVPLEGIDDDGFRLGKGGGYYDCLLADANVMTVGCALTWQRIQHVPREPWDKPLRACVDVKGLHSFTK